MTFDQSSSQRSPFFTPCQEEIGHDVEILDVAAVTARSRDWLADRAVSDPSAGPDSDPTAAKELQFKFGRVRVPGGVGAWVELPDGALARLGPVLVSSSNPPITD